MLCCRTWTIDACFCCKYELQKAKPLSSDWTKPALSWSAVHLQSRLVLRSRGPENGDRVVDHHDGKVALSNDQDTLTASNHHVRHAQAPQASCTHLYHLTAAGPSELINPMSYPPYNHIKLTLVLDRLLRSRPLRLHLHSAMFPPAIDAACERTGVTSGYLHVQRARRLVSDVWATIQ